MIDWEEVESVPLGGKYGLGSLELRPGQIVRRPVNNTGSAGAAYSWAKARPGYHAAVRTIKGQLYLYLWRDPEEA